jgi:cysteine desulfurase family protein (TIGR01976 family)
MVGYYHHSNANWHGHFPPSIDSDAALDAARDSLATFLGAESGRQISIGHNMTTLTFSLSHALAGKLSAGDEIVITALDHEANRGPWLGLRDRGIVVREVALLPDGRLDHDDFVRQVTDRTRLVAVGHASNALGTVNDIAFARRLATAAGAWLVVDAVHSAPHFPLDVAALDVDFLLCSAYKFYGPHVGVLYSRPGLLEELETDRLIVQSDEAPHRIETGTLNHAAIVATGAAVDYIASWGEGDDLRSRIVDAANAIAGYEHGVGRRYWEGARSIPGVRVWGPDFGEEMRAPTVSITVDGLTATEVARKLGDRGIQVWDGHFYAVRAVEVLGLEERGGLVRTGVLMYNTAEEIDRLLEALEEIARGSGG